MVVSIHQRISVTKNKETILSHLKIRLQGNLAEGSFYRIARKGSKLLPLQEEQEGEYVIIFVPYSFQRITSVMLQIFNIYTVEEK